MSGQTNETNGNEPFPLPSAKSFQVADNIIIQAPLTRRGHGPGLILLVPAGLDLNGSDKTLDPPPLQKWAEEGYAVTQVSIEDGLDKATFVHCLNRALGYLEALEECDSRKIVPSIGVIAYDAGISEDVAKAIDETSSLVTVVSYGSNKLQCFKPQLWNCAGDTPPQTTGGLETTTTTFTYPGVESYFAIPAHQDFRSAAAALAHTRSLTFIKPLMNGPYFDLEAIWEEHTKFEFAERAVEKTMSTMVQEPYVNHIPTMTGGIGRERLTNFYRHHFIFNNPDDAALELVSRTVGIDRVIDEFSFSFTHDKEIDWILPGIPPTGRHVKLPFTGVINIRGDRLFHEHLLWDQATLLRQLGLLPEYLPFPYELPDGRKPAVGKRLEYKVPTAGAELCEKLVDERSVESNGMFEFSLREVDG